MRTRSTTGGATEPGVAHHTPAEARALPPPQRVGAYVIEKLQSIGGFATVFRARHEGTGQRVALKILHPYLAADRRTLLRFRQEAELASQLRHPHIVALIEHGDLDGGPPYLVMEWLDGRDLHDEIASRGRLSLAETVGVGTALCDALAAVHALGIVHRDIKDSNVMVIPVTGDGGFTVKLVDFGLAKLFDERGGGREALTRTGSRLGTPHYMAPEVIRGEPVDPRADVYSLGVLLYQLLTGRRPFDAGSPVEIEEMHLSAPRPSAAQLVRVPPALDQLIQRCMSRRREDRPESAAALAVALRAAAAAPQAVAAAERLGVGVYFEARWDGPGEPDDDALDALDAAVADARRACVAAGLEIALEEAGFFLAFARLPEAERSSADLRRRVIDLALGLGAGPRHIVAVHVASVAESQTTFGIRIGGELTRLAGWRPDEVPGTDQVWASAAALRGLEARYVLTPLGDAYSIASSRGAGRPR